MTIQYLPYRDIDLRQWDRCIENAPNGLIYAYSWYLDAMSAHWDALVMNDYEAVMPLTWNRKMGFYYLYPPFYCAQLGVFGTSLEAATVERFLRAIPAKFRFWDYYLNQGNCFVLPGFHIHEKKNYILSLQEPYETLFSHYGESHRRNILRAQKTGNTFRRDIPIGAVIELAEKQAKGFSPITRTDFDHFSGLYERLRNKKMATAYGVFDSRDQLVASCVFTFSHGRAYYIVVGNHPNGRTSGASHLLIDGVIREKAGQPVLLDFEGGNVGGLDFFYRSFGALPERFPWIRENRLPAYARLFKK